MTHVFTQLTREAWFMVKQRYVLALLLCAFFVSAFSVVTGLQEVALQQQTIERLKAADAIDRSEAQQKYNSPGALAYYSFHLTYAPPSSLAFAALGERDVFPWKHRVRMLALEGQIYESDAQNPALAKSGKIDFAFVISVLAPLFIILLFHDLYASERANGRHDFLVSTARSANGLWRARAGVRFIASAVALLIPFVTGAVLSGSALYDVVLVVVLAILYLGFWAVLSVLIGKHAHNAPRVASLLIGVWLLTAFIVPVLGDLAIKHSLHSPKGGDILLTQREAVNDAWDLPVETTMQSFIEYHPEYAAYVYSGDGFDWGWYYAFQQVGDQVTAPLSAEYQRVSKQKYELAGMVAWLSPPALLQRKLSRLAQTDAVAAFEYEGQIREFHQRLRQFYYPWLFEKIDFDKARLSTLPEFEHAQETASP